MKACPKNSKSLEMEGEQNRELLRAAARGDAEGVKALLEEGADLHYSEEKGLAERPKTALYLACEGGHVEAARVLLEQGGETQEGLDTAFAVAGKKKKSK